MARIRNAIHEGVTVEQPIYNNVELTRWIHNGVVVWERGSLIPTPITVQVLDMPKYNVQGYVSYNSTNRKIYYMDSPNIQSQQNCYSLDYSDIGTSAEPTVEWSRSSMEDMSDYLWTFTTHIMNGYRTYGLPNDVTGIPWKGISQTFLEYTRINDSGTGFLIGYEAFYNVSDWNYHLNIYDYSLSYIRNWMDVGSNGTYIPNRSIAYSTSNVILPLSGSSGSAPQQYDLYTYNQSVIQSLYDYITQTDRGYIICYFAGYIVVYKEVNNETILFRFNVDRNSVHYQDALELCNITATFGYTQIVGARIIGGTPNKHVANLGINSNGSNMVMVIKNSSNTESRLLVIDTYFNLYISDVIGGDITSTAQVIEEFVFLPLDDKVIKLPTLIPNV